MRITLGILSLLVCGCFGEDPIIGGGDDGDATDTEDTATEGGTMSSASVGSMSGSATSGSMTSVDPSMSADATSSEPTVGEVTGPSETGNPSCGLLGEQCCVDQLCDEGSCWRDRCSVFAGMYGMPQTCEGACDPSGNMGDIPAPTMPWLGGCECPPGFETAPPLPSTTDYCPVMDLLHTNTPVFFCQYSAAYATSDWRGAYARSNALDCQVSVGETCIQPNVYTGDCTCPGGDDIEVVAHTVAQCGGDGSGDSDVDIHICINEGVEPINFGGAFQWAWDDDPIPTCTAGNPLADLECDCPSGFVYEGLRLTDESTGFGGEVMICVRY